MYSTLNSLIEPRVLLTSDIQNISVTWDISFYRTSYKYLTILLNIKDFYLSNSNCCVGISVLDHNVSFNPPPPRPLPAVCGGDVRAVGAGVGRGGALHRAPALHSVCRLPALPPLRAVLHVRSRRHLLLLPGRPPLPPHRPNHPDQLQLNSPSSRLDDGTLCFTTRPDIFPTLSAM